VLAFVAIASVLGIGLWIIGGADGGAIDEVTAGEKALATARDNLRLVFDNGANLVDDPSGAEELLLEANEQLDLAAASGVPATTIRPLRERVVAGLDERYGVVEVAPATAFSFAGQEQPFDLVDLVPGPDGMPYVLDAATQAVYRVDLQEQTATPVIRAGAKAGSAEVATPRHLAVGGPDTLALDDKNVLWRWRPADKKGKGTLARVRVNETSTWGADIAGIGTYLRDADAGLYNLYVIDPSEQQILRYTPASDGSGFIGAPSRWLTTPQDVSRVTSMAIDGDVYLADGGVVTRFQGGKSGSWAPADLPDGILRPPPAHRLVATPDGRGEGVLYTYDPGSDRIIAYDKPSGRYIAQYRIADGGPDWGDLRAFYVVNRAQDQAPLVYWIDGQRVGTTALQDVSELPPPTIAPLVSPGPTPAESPKPTKKP
jgi:hypothetical protein